MVSDELRAYLRENLSKGYKDDELTETLVRSGWDIDDVRAGLAELNTSGQEIVAVSETATQTSLDPVSSEISSTVNTESQAVVTHQATNAVLEETPSSGGGMTQMSPDTTSRKSLILILAGVASLLIFGSAAAGYYFLADNAPLPEEKLELMQNAMTDVKSYAFDMKYSMDIHAKPQGEMLQAANSYIGKGSEGTLKLAITTKGVAVIGEDVTKPSVDMTYDINGNASYGAVSVVIDGTADIRTIDGKVYFRLTKMPQLLAMIGMTETFGAWKDKWILIDTSATSSIFAKEFEDMNEKVQSPEARAEQEKVKKLLKENWPIVLSVPKDDSVSINGVDTYHYHFTVDKEKLATLLHRIIDLYPDKEIKQDTTQLKEGIDIIAKIFANSTGELYIGKKDSYLYQTNINIPVDYSTTSVTVSGSMDFALNSSSFNAVSPIVAPSDATAIEDVYKSITNKMLGGGTTNAHGFAPSSLTGTGSASIKSRDARRISDIAMLQMGVDLYFDAHQSYPLTLAPLVTEEFIPSTLTDPSTKKAYGYHPFTSYDLKKRVGVECKKTPCNSYMLGASLEDKTNFVLQRDADVFFVTYSAVGTKPTFMVGNDSAGCFAEKNLYCYDIVP